MIILLTSRQERDLGSGVQAMNLAFSLAVYSQQNSPVDALLKSMHEGLSCIKFCLRIPSRNFL
jgi:hypothetical protein